jgi:DTW domain-containing protein YfiP
MARLLCPRCGRPVSRGCLCDLVVRVDNEVDVLLLQHPREQDEAKGTARLLELSLARCRREVGEVFEPGALHAWLHDGRRSVLLYPPTAEDDGAEPPAADVDAASTDEGPLQLVVLDATWRKSLRMLRSNPALPRLPRLTLDAVPPSTSAASAASAPRAYPRLRPARRTDQLSTLEAVCVALGQVEGHPGRYAPLEAALARFVERSLAARGTR